MADIPFYDHTGRKAGMLEIDEKIFGDRVRSKLLHQMVIAYEANQRAGTHKSKTKGEVKGSSRKPWPQKHTGRARAGMIRSPIWRKGGTAHAIRPRDYSHKTPKSMRSSALNSAYLGKIADRELHVIEDFRMDKPKTKAMLSILEAIGFQKSVLVGTATHDRNAWLSTRNLPRVSMRQVRQINAYDLLRHKDVLLTRAALEHVVKARNGQIKGPRASKG